MVNRLFNPPLNRSFFLFGARGTGKSTILRESFTNEKTLRVDLLLPSQFDRLARDSESLLRQIKEEKPSWVVIDEVQKLPELLDLVHYAIEEFKKDKIKFALLGSSARKLKRSAANLLAGRASVNYLFPLTTTELGSKFSLSEALNFGSLPELLNLTEDRDKIDYLSSYAHTYIKEEILVEQLVRILPPFRRFLEIAAQMNGQPVNFAAVAKDVGVDDKTVKNYYSVLEDTLLGFFLESYSRSIRKTQLQSPRFYLFDLGVKRALENTLQSQLLPGTYGWGAAFEHLVICEIYRLNWYKKLNYKLSFLRTQAGAEIDLILERPDRSHILIEIKSTTSVKPSDIKHLELLRPEFRKAESFLLSLDERSQRIGDTTCLFWTEGLERFGFR